MECLICSIKVLRIKSKIQGSNPQEPRFWLLNQLHSNQNIGASVLKVIERNDLYPKIFIILRRKNIGFFGIIFSKILETTYPFFHDLDFRLMKMEQEFQYGFEKWTEGWLILWWGSAWWPKADGGVEDNGADDVRLPVLEYRPIEIEKSYLEGISK